MTISTCFPVTFSVAGGRTVLLAAAAGLAAAFAVPAGARAAEPWEAGCAYKMTSGTPGSGWGIVADNCNKMQFCQRMAEQGKIHMMQMGCFNRASAASAAGFGYSAGRSPTAGPIRR